MIDDLVLFFVLSRDSFGVPLYALRDCIPRVEQEIHSFEKDT